MLNRQFKILKNSDILKKIAVPFQRWSFMKKENNNLNLNPPQINTPEGIIPFLDYVPFGYIRISVDGLILEINRTMLEWIGFVKDEARGKLSINDLVGENSRMEFKRDLSELENSGRLKDSELEIRRKDGTRFFALISGLAAKEKDGRNRYFWFTVYDISRVKRAEYEAQLNKNVFNAVINAAQESIYLIDKDATVLAANTIAAKRAGKSGKEFVGSNAFEGLPAGTKEQRLRIVEIVAASGKEVKFEFKQDDRIFESVVYPVCNGIDTAIRFAIYSTDVTDQRRAFAEALKEGEREKAVIEQAPFGAHMFELMDDGNLIFFGANPAADKILGFSNSELFGKTLEEAFPGNSGTEIPETYKRIAALGGTYHKEQYSYSDGKIAGVFDVNAFQPSKNRLVVFFRDITGKIKAEAEADESQNKLKFIFDTLEQGVIFQDGKGKIVELNAAACRLLGRSEKELLSNSFYGKGWRIVNKDMEVLKDEERPSYVAVKSGKPVTHKLVGVFISSKNAYNWLIENSVPKFREGDAKPYLVITSFSDVTAIKETEQQERLKAEIAGAYNFALLKLSRINPAGFEEFAEAALASGAVALKIARISLWQFTRSRKELRCSKLYIASSKKYSSGMSIQEHEYPLYFKALESGRIVSAADALMDSRTSEFTKDHLLPHNIFSVLAVPLMRGGKPAGVICCESVGEKREWTAEEEEFVSALADMALFSLERRDRELAEHALKVQNEVFSKINELAFDLASLPSEIEIQALLIKWLFDTSGAAAAWFSDYDLERKTLVVREFESRSGFFHSIIKALGRFPQEFNSPVDEKAYTKMTGPAIYRLKSLNELSTSDSRQLMSDAVQKIIGIERFVAIFHKVEDSLFGVSILGFRAGEPDPSDELLGSYASLASVSLKQRKIAESLLESEDRFRRVFAGSPVGKLILNKDTSFISANEAFCRMLGYSENELMSLGLEAITPAEDRTEEVAAMKALENGKLKQFVAEKRFKRKDGSLFWGKLTASIMKEGRGRVKYFLGMVEDISERKNAEIKAGKEAAWKNAMLELYEKAPKLSEKELYSYLLDKVTELTESEVSFLHLVSDDQKDITLTAWNGNAMKNCSVKASFHYPAENAGNWADSLRQKKPVIYNNFTDSPNRKGLPEGHVQLTRFMSVPVLENEKVKFIFGVGNRKDNYNEDDTKQIQLLGVDVQNILSKRRSEADLLASREEYRSLVENIKDVIFVLGSDGILKYVSPAAKLFGYTQADLEGKAFSGIIFPEDLTSVVEGFNRAIAGISRSIEYRVYTKEGKLRWVRSSSSVITEDGEITGIRGVLSDIHERKQTEAVIMQAQKLESLGVIAGGIAHDFNNLLAGMFGYIEIARLKAKDDPAVIQSLDSAVESFNRAKDLTQQLLTFSKGGTPAKKPCDLGKLLKKNVQFALSGSNIATEYSIPEDSLICAMDENQISQVIDNIVINAVQAMPSGGSLKVSAGRTSLNKTELCWNEKPGLYLYFEITDSGAGITKDILGKIFDPFFTTKPKGSGLGLATAYSIINKHGGVISVDSTAGKGTSMKVYLPYLAGGTIEDKQKPQGMVEGKGRILVLDDEPAILKMTTTVLSGLGYGVATAVNLNEALKVLKTAADAKTPFDLIITDLTIPGGPGGMEFIKELRALDKDVPVIASSGYAENDAMSNPAKYGFCDSLVKPYLIEVLSAKVKACIKK